MKGYKELIEAVSKKQYAPIYLLMGEEPYFIDKASDYIENTFFENEDMKDFNFQLLYGMETTVNQIVSYAKEFPMMADFRLVIVREAQNVAKIEQMAEYAKNPQRKTVLVLCYKHKKMDGRTELFKAINKNGTVFESTKVYENQLPAYIKEMVKEKKRSINDAAVNLLANHIGVDLSRIGNELDKLENVIPQGSEVTVPIIEQYIGISKEYNIFELVSAIIARNPVKTYDILNYFSNSPANFVKTLTFSALFSAFHKLLQYHFSVDKSETFLRSIGVFWTEYRTYQSAASYYSVRRIVEIMHLIRKYDLMSKGGAGTTIEEPELIKELVFQIF
ncbi:MAG: DNA polymerase III subunit delta [Lentimicrobiaceae bacterium]|nr:DNA polymerase III subunit delta [Lentimicrobiaceae bacterium]